MIGPSDAFIWGSGGAQLTPSQIDAQRKVAQALMAQGTDYSPVQSWSQGAARVAQALFGGMQAKDANEAAKANTAFEADLLAKYLPGGGGTTGVATTPTSGVSTPMGQTSIPAGKDEFVSSVMPMAEKASLKTGVDPRLIVAQAAIESGYGQHAPGNNLFGIKSHGQPGGNTLATTEVVNGQPVRTKDSFRSYASPADSVMGYADFINSNPRYSGLKGATGLDAQVSALGKSGYATDPDYAAKVGSIARSIPVPAPQVIDANAPSPLDGAAYPAGPIGAPGTQVAQNDPAAIPVNAQPTQGYAIPGQAQAPAAPIINPAVLSRAAPYLSPFTQKLLGGAMLQQMEAAQKANDPLRQLQVEEARTKLTPFAAPHVDEQGNLVQTDALGKVTVLSQAPHKGPEFGVIGKDQFGNDQYGWRDPRSMSVTGPDGRPVQPTASPQATVTGPDGKQIPVPEGVDPKAFRTEVTKATADAATGKKTEVQGKAEQFANRMETAEASLSGGLEKQALGASGAFQSIAGGIPFGSSMQSGDFQRYTQAKSQFVTALLRQESGAAIGREEFNRYDKEFFPQPGDTQATIEQKAQSRRVAIEAMKKGAGPSYKPPALDSVAASTPGKAPMAGAQPGAIKDGATATNPQTGEIIIRKNGKWVPMS